MNSRGSSILGRASSSEGSTSNQDESDLDQSFKSENHFFDAIKKNPEMCNTLHESPNLSTHGEEYLQNPVDLICTPPLNQRQWPEKCEEEECNNFTITVPISDKRMASDMETHASKNPFTFSVPKEITFNTSGLSRTGEMLKTRKLSETTLVTINTITELLKQLHRLDDTEKEMESNQDNRSLMADAIPSNANSNSQKPTFEGRKKCRPQLIIKKMKSMLSTSTSGAKSEREDLDSICKNTTKPIMEIGSTKDEQLLSDDLMSLRVYKHQLSKQTMCAVETLRDDISESMPGVVRRRARKCSSVSPSPSINGLSSDSELPLLLGRCFNLSINLKILTQCDFADPNIACRVFVDLDVLENYTKRKVKECEASVNINHSDPSGNNTLSPKQLEAEINSLSIGYKSTWENPSDYLSR